MALSGMSRTEAARSQGVSAQTLRAWIIMYDRAGIEGLRPCLRGGRRCRLSEEDTRELVATVVAGPDIGAVSPSRYRVCDIVVMIEDLFGIRYSWEGVRKMLHRLRLAWISPRPLHPKADLETQEAFRRDFPDLVRRKIGPKVALTKPEVWFQDEARLGQMGILHHIRAPKGTRPRKARDCRFKSRVLFSAICPASHQGVAHLCARSNTVEMNRHLGSIGTKVQEGYHAVVILDRATWHQSKDLNVPSNLTLLHLPPYSPELNPMENVYNYLKATCHANQVFENLEDVKANVRRAWMKFMDDPILITSIMHRKWVRVPELKE